MGLAALYAVGSPQSKERDERKEKKLDLILRKVDAENAVKEIEKLTVITLEPERQGPASTAFPNGAPDSPPGACAFSTAAPATI
jgi:hypothetical protein